MGNILSSTKLKYFNIVLKVLLHYQDAIFVFMKSDVYVL